MTVDQIRDLIAQMTVEEKAGLCSGKDFWNTKAIERLGVPSTLLSDGPHGLRKQAESGDHLGINDSIEAVCFPAASATAASFDRDLLQELGETLGRECQAEGVSVLLGPAVNIKRSPLCGRNFEYFSEDPYLTTELAASYIDGVESQDVGTSIKHFLANNQETRRMSVSAEVDERALREIYLAAFETAIKRQKPWTVMCAYNKINGTYAPENHEYLTRVLRDEWGFDGYVVSDWGATNKRVEDLIAGMDLEMPSSGGLNDKLIVEAVTNGTLDEGTLDQAVERILTIVYRFTENRPSELPVFDRDKDHEIARKIAENSIVLLKNDAAKSSTKAALPLDKDDNVLVIGQYAKAPRFQGGGSSHINAHKVTSALDALEEKGIKTTFALGFEDKTDEVDETLIEEAVALASKANAAVIFAGLPDAYESEGFDRKHMKLPDVQNELIKRVAAVQERTIVVLHNGSPVEMPWAGDVLAIVEAYLGGQAVGTAVVNVLYGDINPSGKLAETFPLRLEDNPSYLNFPGEKDKVYYREGIYVGYRYYNSKQMDVLFPFGHGLSYTTFEYQNLKIQEFGQDVLVSADIKNTGEVFGKEAVQVYVSTKTSHVNRPIHELRDFQKVSLDPGETKTVQFKLGRRAFSYWNSEISDWHVEPATYEIQVASSSRDIRLRDEIFIRGRKLRQTYTLDSTIGDLMEDPIANQYIQQMMKQSAFLEQAKPEESDAAKQAISAEMMQAMMNYMPVRAVISFGFAEISLKELQGLLDQLNAYNMMNA